MKTENVTLLGWQARCGAEKTCLDQLIRYRWPDGFISSYWGQYQGCFIDGWPIYQ